ncbi:TonB-dependent receptor plug domain-containing protein, partial [Haemophilus influenzae]|uniref:TonB-dependent receptor plug domain-containing protein n=1 Tax=Haemophilus influenzae TaxID=727 RepID=UPI00352EEBB6
MANTTADKAEATDKTNLVVVLDETVVTAKKNARKANEVTGLGKVVKTAETINKEQVLNIRDLTRYDPGIAVVEQGRGASSGYSIRGMDKNRVAVLVDGINQAQHYALQGPVAGKNYAAGGAINEIEYENVRSVEISKGANSSEYGSGALSGS